MSYHFDHRAVAAYLHERIIGQEEALEQVEAALAVAQAGISEKDKPLYTALFLGPTGVGKTETVRALSVALCGDVEAHCRVDMNTLAQEHYSASLVGAPPGYVGSREEATVLNKEKIEGSFYLPGIVLFDEIEKASDTVLQALMNIMDNGFLQLASGSESIRFTNTLVFMTSNIGGREIQEYAHNRWKFSWRKTIFRLRYRHWRLDDASVLAWIIDKKLHKRFAPEFLNRMDDIIVFNWLDRHALDRIFDIIIADLNKRLYSRNVSLSVDSAAREFLLEVGFDRRFGARFLKRAFRRYVENPLARLLLADRQPEDPLELVAVRDPHSTKPGEAIRLIAARAK
ncbi:MAG: AAA family ATPase [Chloroflexi bacterium]|nr:AAA family ATPase [Chloroflexota bacterium]